MTPEPQPTESPEQTIARLTTQAKQRAARSGRIAGSARLTPEEARELAQARRALVAKTPNPLRIA